MKGSFAETHISVLSGGGIVNSHVLYGGQEQKHKHFDEQNAEAVIKNSLTQFFLRYSVKGIHCLN